jgi:hypothetical protein
MQRAGSADELQNFLADAVHIDGQRHATEADEGETQFFFPHASAFSLAEVSGQGTTGYRMP